MSVVDTPSDVELKQIRAWVETRARLHVSNDADCRDVVSAVVSDYWKFRNRALLEAASQDNKDNLTDGGYADQVDGARYGLAAQILKWRIADHYRSRLSAPSTVDISNHDISTAAQQSPYHAALGDSVLTEIMRLIARLPESDRELLLRDVSPDAPDLALSVLERKQLSRARHKLATTLKSRFGESITALMQEDTDIDGK